MADSLAGVVLAAGAGTRLRPLTLLRPKALCPVGEAPLVDHALERLSRATPSVAVNVHAGRDEMVDHLDGRAHLSIEEPVALGTAGALGALRDWIDGRPVLVTNADAWLPGGLSALVDGWDGERMRLLCVDDPAYPDFGRRRYAGACLLPWAEVRDLPAEPLGLYEARWAAAAEAGRLDFADLDGPFLDCGTPADYLAANLAWSGGEPVVGEGAVVRGTLVRSVVWPGGRVGEGEVLVDAVRAGRTVTVLVRRPGPAAR
jgi:N-acetyl-alpha-D-muramate 1-phosphate uridylyltransferase